MDFRNTFTHHIIRKSKKIEYVMNIYLTFMLLILFKIQAGSSGIFYYHVFRKLYLSYMILEIYILLSCSSKIIFVIHDT